MLDWLTRRRSALTDEFLESYVCWREACEDVSAAYRQWEDSNSKERDLGFATYRAALEREELAASIHSEWTERVRALGPGRADISFADARPSTRA